MGKAIERIARDRGHVIVQRVGSENPDEPPAEDADVVIEFSKPSTVVRNLKACIEHGKPVVVGTTGWLDHLPMIEQLVQKESGSLLYASNFSVGMNLFFEVNRHLAKLMNGRAEYKASVEETHHVHKLDAPSGTAISLAEQMLEEIDGLDSWGESAEAHTLPITATREGEVSGTHTVHYASSIDTISIEHRAHSRTGFAIGAVLAAEWLPGKQGVHTMKDLLRP